MEFSAFSLSKAFKQFFLLFWLAAFRILDKDDHDGVEKGRDRHLIRLKDRFQTNGKTSGRMVSL